MVRISPVGFLEFKMKLINTIFFIIIFWLGLFISNVFCERPVLSLRLVHPDHDKLCHISQSKAQVDKNRYEFFLKDNESYWVDRKIELDIKDFKDAKIQEMVRYPPKTTWEKREVTSPLPPNATCDVLLYLSKTGQEKIKNLTKKNIKRRIAIIYNNKLLMAPLILETITGDSFSIVGISYNEAQALKNAIK